MQNNKIFLSLISSLIITTNIVASESFSIAPPPVSADSIMADSGEQNVIGISYTGYSSDDFDLTGIGFVFGNKYKDKSGLIFEPSVGLSVLQGEGSGSDIVMTAIDTNLMIGQKISDLTLFVGLTANLSNMFMESEG